MLAQFFSELKIPTSLNTVFGGKVGRVLDDALGKRKETKAAA